MSELFNSWAGNQATEELANESQRRHERDIDRLERVLIGFGMICSELSKETL